jgi:hypothetical protein
MVTRAGWFANQEGDAMEGRFLLRLIMGACVLGAVVSCSDDWNPPTDPTETQSTVAIQMTSDPLVFFDASSGKTGVVVQFIARDGTGGAMNPEEVRVELLVNGRPVDNESLLQEDAEELSASIYLSLVLDASYSMLLHDPPAFGPMLQAARDALVKGKELFAGRSGTFTWNLSWFNEVIFSPSRSGRAWLPDDLLVVPEPGPGTATKLFAAVEEQALRMQEAYDLGVAAGPHDHHIMVVFSDGADNYSWFDNSSYGSGGVTSSGAPYEVSGYGVSSLESAVAAIEAHPHLTAYVIGLGSEIRDAQLQPLSRAGDGRYFKNPSSSKVGSLFGLVTREFATIQNHGATIPLPPGDYNFTLRVLTRDRRSHDQIQFSFHGGDGEAGILR